ncbi:MAG: hypothetical protein MUF45_14960 [Spirosomaceae bacterium]|nr:hypothetical protein [Spirosomataceae bacterium]
MKKNIDIFRLFFCIYLIQISVFAQNNQPVEIKNEAPIQAVGISFDKIAKYHREHPDLKKTIIKAENNGVKNPKFETIRNKKTPKNLESKPMGQMIEANPDISTKNARVNEPFPCRNFGALNQLNNSIPPDVNGAVGFNHVMTTLNDQVRIQDKNGNILSTVTLLAFFQAAFGGVTDVFDPKITYDPYNHRYIFVVAAQRRSAASSFILAISQSADPTAGWWFYQIDADGDDNEWFDYPSMGFNKKWIMVNGNMFGNPLADGGSTIRRNFVFRKFDLYAGAGTTYNSWDVSAYSTICPAITLDNNIEELWCVTNDDVNDNDLRLFKVSGGYTTPSFTEEGWITVGTDWAPTGPTAPQSGGTGIDAGDHRVQSVFYRGGSLWSAQTVFLPVSNPTTATAQFVRMNPYAETHIETIRVGSSSTSMFAYPSVAINADGDLFTGFAAFSTTTFASGWTMYRRNGSSTFNFFNIANGLGNYVANDSKKMIELLGRFKNLPIQVILGLPVGQRFALQTAQRLFRFRVLMEAGR